MQPTSSSHVLRSESILEWLEQEMGYRSHHSADAISKISRGNMLPVWKFLVERVKAEKSVEKARRNIDVHGSSISGLLGKSPGKEQAKAAVVTKDSNAQEDLSKHFERERRRPFDSKVKGNSGLVKVSKLKEDREKEKRNGRDSGSGETKEKALSERDAAQSELMKSRLVLERLLKEIKGRMLDLSMEESERQRVLEDGSYSRQKQVILEVFDQRMEQATRILSEYWRRLHGCVEHAREAQRGKTGWSESTLDYSRFRKEPTLFATAVKGDSLADDQILIETSGERSIRVTCELLSAVLIEKIRSAFPAYDGVNTNEGQAEETKLGFDVEGEGMPDQVKETALRLLRSPPQFLQAMVTYTSRIVTTISSDTERIDTRADAERLRYRYENNKITEDMSPAKDKNSSTGQQRNKGMCKTGLDLTRKSIFRQLRERQAAHVHQFMATEEMLNQAAEAKRSSEEITSHMDERESSSMDIATPFTRQDLFQNANEMRQLELKVWAQERELAGLEASLEVLLSEVQRLQLMCEERKQAKDDLKKKWRKIEEFNTRRVELESVYTALIHANMAASASWEQHMVAALEHSTNTILPICAMLQNNVTEAVDLVERELAAFQKCPDNRLYRIPASTQGLLDAMGASNSAGPEAVAAAHRNADLQVARAGAGDPSVISSVGRITAALQNSSGERADVGLVAVVESLKNFFQHRVSAANLVEDLARVLNHMQILRDLVSSGRVSLDSANSSRPEYERNAASCTSTAADHERIALEEWLPELKGAMQEAQKSLENSKRVRGLVDEWWEQPASIAVDWITLDDRNVVGWLAHVKQMQATFYDKELM